MEKGTKRMGYLKEKEHKWVLTIDEKENTFTSEFSANYFAMRNKIKRIHLLVNFLLTILQ